MTERVPGRFDAIQLVRDDRARTSELLGRLSEEAFVTAGLGRGTWSPKDLVGHLETWEEFAIEALEAFDRAEPAPISQQSLDTDTLNRREVERKAERDAADLAASAAATHERLVAALTSVADERWDAPEGAGTERTVGDRLGSILGGSRGYFRHDADHWDDLEAFAAEHASG